MPTLPADKLPPRRRIFCNHCKTETNHVCKAEHSIRFSGEFYELLGFRLWICAGCEHGTMEKFYTNENMEDSDGNESFEIVYFPERTEMKVEEKKFKQLPDKLDTIYRQTLKAYNSELSILCAIGIRALIEGICADKNIKGRNLQESIEKMRSILPENIVTNLHSLRFIGNTAAHELDSPDMPELALAIELCEDLLSYLYELDYKARRLARLYEAKRGKADPADLIPDPT